MRYFLRHITHMSLPVALALLVGILGLWSVDYIRRSEQWGLILLAQGLSLMNALLLSSVLYRAKATAHFSLIPAILYLVTTAIFPYLRLHWTPQVPVLVIALFLLVTRDISDDHEPNSVLFLITVLLCTAAFIVPDAIWCIAYLWVTVLIQGCFSLRSVLSSLLGAGLCATYYLLFVYMGWMEAVDWSVLVNRQWFATMQPAQIVTAVVTLLAVFLYVSGAAFRRSSYDLVSTRMLLYQTVMLGLMSAPLILLSAAQSDILCLMPLSMAGTAGIYLLQTKSESRGITLLVYLVGAITLYLTLLISL